MIVVTLRDIIGLSFLGLGALFLIVLFVWACIEDWRNSK